MSQHVRTDSLKSKKRRLYTACVGLAALMFASWTAPAQESVKATGRVILLTDYGTDSIYVGILKGAIYSKFGDARIDAITNAVPSFDIVAGAYLLAEAAGEYPPGTVFCCVVDPGVGTERKSIAMRTKSGHYFVSPDNGLLTLVADQLGVQEVRECTSKKLWRADVTSAVFHGRDIYGPVSAALASGVTFREVGQRLPTFIRLDLPSSRVQNDAVHGAVMRSDTYGNLVTNITGKDLEALGIERGDSIEVTIGESTYTAPFQRTYADVPIGERLVVLQSSGFVECSVNRGSLRDELTETAHAAVTLKKAD